MVRFFIRGQSSFLRKGSYGLAALFPFLVISSDLKLGRQADFSLPSSNSVVSHEGNIDKNKSGKTLIGNSSTDNRSNEFFRKANKKNDSKVRVLISEVVIKGLDNHPDQERLEFAAYDAMKSRPGSSVTRQQLKLDLDAVYATGWFSGVKIDPVNTPLGVQLLVNVEPNPVLNKVELSLEDEDTNQKIIDKIFSPEYGKTLNLNILQLRMKELRKWYVKQGYSLARISGPSRINSDGVVKLTIIQGVVSDIEVQFLNQDGETNNEEGNLIKGKTKKWVVKREISIKPGESFNRNALENDIKRLYGTSLFSDIKVTLKPVSKKPGHVKIILGITEQTTGSLSGGIGYSQSQGVFGQVGIQDTNLLGRAWSSTLNLTYGQYGGLANLSFSDPWIRGDEYRTSFRTSIFLSREVPQIFRSDDSGIIRTLKDYNDSGSNYAFDISSDEHSEGKFSSVADAKKLFPEKSWFEYEGNSVALQRKGFNFSFARPLNGGDPYKKVPWSVLLGMNIQSIKPIDYSGDKRPYGAVNRGISQGKVLNSDVICIAFNCAEENSLFGVRAAATYNKLNDSRNPTSGNFLSFGSEQFISIGENSPTFNRARMSYSHFIPVNWLKIAKGCRPKSGEKSNCPQAVGIQLKAATILGQLPPYEAFCIGGSNSVRGWSSCDLAVGRSYGEASVEYRFPIWNIVSGSVFVDAGSDLGSQSNVPGKPGKLLEKPGSGFSLGSGLIVNTPVGPLRLEAASQDLDGEWRFNLGVGWKF